MRQVGKRIYDLLLGCPHGNMSRPFTIHGRTYCVCCDCGHEFSYSLKSMSIVACDYGNDDLRELAMQHSQ
jgi:hypothetical protein